MKERVVIAGFGGQGIMFAGELLAWAAMREGKNVAMITSYGPETRGGTVNAMLIISDAEIDSPLVEHLDTVLVMNKPSLEKFEAAVKPGGLLILNESLINQGPARKNLVVIRIPANDIAKNLGNPDLTNALATIVMVGRYVEKKQVISENALLGALEKILAKKGRQYLIEINKKALRAGTET